MVHTDMKEAAGRKRTAVHPLPLTRTKPPPAPPRNSTAPDAWNGITFHPLPATAESIMGGTRSATLSGLKPPPQKPPIDIGILPEKRLSHRQRHIPPEEFKPPNIAALADIVPGTTRAAIAPATVKGKVQHDERAKFTARPDPTVAATTHTGKGKDADTAKVAEKRNLRSRGPPLAPTGESASAGALRVADSAAETTKSKERNDAARGRRSKATAAATGAPAAPVSNSCIADYAAETTKPKEVKDAAIECKLDAGKNPVPPVIRVSKKGAVAKNKGGISKGGSRHLACEHKARRTQCAQCSGGSVCVHGRQKHLCKVGDCKGTSLCVHYRQKSKCKQCS